MWTTPLVAEEVVETVTKTTTYSKEVLCWEFRNTPSVYDLLVLLKALHLQ